ncbi:MAG: type I DNA topoisomerase [Clostridia bacterium]|nr:type I DNA topoisomerase [Clostridia bacterium]
MAENLIIVESPSKAKTIEKYLGSKFKVIASNGHVRDLPKSQLGVEIEDDFAPKYITLRGRGDVIEKIRREAKAAKQIYLATDPDREGEAISWHLANMLKLKPEDKCRIVFNEITKGVIQKSIKSPRTIDLSLVDAQQARRVLDRLLGYKISPLLWMKVKKGLSAGRVQSVTTKIICDREREIQDFVPKEYWTISVKLHHGRHNFEAKFNGLNGKKYELSSEEQAKRIVDISTDADYVVSGVKTAKKSRHAPAPYTTSSMLQDASNRVSMPPKRTMLCAQQLYEGINIKGKGSIGLITYMRTDSVRISKEAQDAARAFIAEKFGAQYVPERPNFYRGRSGAQDAHEAIRPTDVTLTPALIKDSLEPGQYKLYKLIYERFIASQMSEAVIETTTVSIDTQTADVCNYRASGSKTLFDGFTAVYKGGADDEEDDGSANLPQMAEGDAPKYVSITPKQNFTEPPPRYTEASLVKTLEELGIGRPSTYSPTISTIIDRGYVEKEKKQLVPTELGFIVNKLMEDNFSKIVDVKFTADMESSLDSIEDGNVRWQSIVSDFYTPFKEDLDKAFANTPKVELKPEVSDVPCEKCGAMMVYKEGRFGRFLACPNYPKCKNTKTIVDKIGVKCPKCGADIIKRQGKKGKSFYGCERYPDCDYVSWDKPTGESCPKCGKMLVQKIRVNGRYTACEDKDCGYIKRKESKKTEQEKDE